jgi:hypothetical protein
LRKDGIEYNNLNKKDKEDLLKTHKNFYNSVKKNVKKEFFKNEEGCLINFKYNK